MMYTCSPGCADPAHRHQPARKTRAVATKVAKTRKGASVRVDMHCHYLNPDVAAKTAHLNPAQYEPHVKFANPLTRDTNMKQMRDRAPMLSSIERRLKDMDRMGIDIQAVSPAPFQYHYWAEPGFAAELSREVNDRIAAIVAATPDRFVGMGTVPLQNVELALAELDRCVGQLGMRGIEICTMVNGMDLTDPRLGLEKFFARAEALGVVLFLHPIGFDRADRLVDHYFNNVIGNPMDSTICVSHLIFDGVMDRHPKLKVLVAHGGGYLAHYWARMDHAHRARPDTKTVIRRKPSSYLKKFYFDTITFDPQMLRHLVDQYGAAHVVLGTDYPYDMMEVDPVGLVDSVPRLSRAERELIMGGNAQKLLKIRR